MKRKLLFAALCAVMSVLHVKAYTISELESAGWTKVTSLSDVSNYYYVFIDAGTSNYVMGRMNAGSDKPNYMPLADPMGFAGVVWYLGADGDNYTIKSLVDDNYFISGTGGWNDQIADQQWGNEGLFTFTATLPEGKFSIKSVKTSKWVGPWNNDGAVAISNGYEGIAANKEEAQAPGFYLYSMPRSEYNAKRITDSWLTSHGWSQVTANSGLGNSDNYYLVIEKVSFGYALARTSNGRPASKSLSNPFAAPNELWLTAASGSGYTFRNVIDNTYFTSAAGDWNTSMGNAPNADIIATVSEGVYTLSAGGTSNIGHWRDDTNFPYENESVAANKNDANRNSYYIYTISKADYATERASYIASLASSATNAVPVDLTSYVFNNSDFATLAKLGWSVSGTWGNQQTGNGAYETWNSNAVSITQELKGMPGGKYQLSVQMVSGDAGRVPYLYASADDEYTENVTQQATTATYDGMKNEIEASSSYGLLTVTPYSSDGNMTVGMKAPSGWVVFDNFKVKYFGPTLASTAVALPDGGAMTAGTWYYFDIAIDGTYDITTTTLGDIVYSTDGKVLIENQGDVTDNFSGTSEIALKAGRYYVKSSSSNKLIVIAHIKTYSLGSITAQSISNGEYIKSLTTLVLTYGDAATNDEDASLEIIGTPVATLKKGDTPITTGTLTGNDAAKTLTATFTDVDLTINSADYSIVIPAGAFGYAGESVNTEETVTFNTPLFADGDYYLKNKDNEAYFAGGNFWGTQAVTNKIGHKVYLTALSNGKYTINTYLFNGGKASASHFLNGLWCDGVAAEWTFAESGEYYTINDGTNNLTAGAVGETMTLTSATGDAVKWSLLSVSDWKAEQVARLDAAAADNGIDATFYIASPNFNRNDDYENEKWQGSPGIAGLDGGSVVCNYNAQKYNVTPFDVYQEIAGLKAGIYKLTAQGFYRNGTTDNRNAILYANDRSVELVNIRSAGVTAQDDDKGFTTANGDYYVPNTQTEAAKAFNNDYYNNELYFAVSADGTLRIGVRKSTGASGDWTVFDNFQLTYYGQSAESVAEFIEYTKGDITSLINGDFDANAYGWTSYDGYTTTADWWSNRGWRGNVNTGWIQRNSDGTMTCTLSGMPAGSYKVVAAARAYAGGKMKIQVAGGEYSDVLTGAGDTPADDMEINTNGVEMPYSSLGGFTTVSEGHNWHWITATGTLASAGDLIINVNCAGSDWMAIDDVHLYCTNYNSTSYTRTVGDGGGTINTSNSVVTADIIMENPNTTLRSTGVVTTAAGQNMNNNQYNSSRITKLVLYDGYDYTPLSGNVGADNGAVLYRNIPAETWCTLSVPFWPTTTLTKKYPSSFSEETLTFSDVDRESWGLNKPMLIKSASALTAIEGKIASTSGGGCGVDHTEAQTSGTGVPMTGVYASGTVPTSSSDTYYYVVGNDDKLHKVIGGGTGVTIAPFRAYFTLDNTSSVKGNIITLNFDDTETGIVSIEKEQMNMEDAVIYNLAGQRLNKAQKGVNIINGKKVLVK